VRCADLCTGSGAIALALATEVPETEVDAVELDGAALAWARRNLDALGGEPAGRVRLHQADIRAGLPAGLRHLRGQLDLVVANPPYLPAGLGPAGLGPAGLEPEVADHDPSLALWGGPDGLAGPRAAAELARELLRPGGVVVIEHDDSHGVSLPAALAEAGAWVDVQDHPDLAGRDRFVTATLAVSTGPAGEREEKADD
jgi:release factor glutamine methyltransferase